MKNSKNNGVWIGVDQLNNESAFKENAKSEFVELPVVDQLSEEKAINTNTNRRDFLKYLGFGLGAATIAACDIPVRRAIPYVVKPDDIVPGVASYYASSIVNGGDYCSVLVKTREGRPIKIEGNTLSPVSKGGTSARAQASVLSLYDTTRIQGPAVIEDGMPEKPASGESAMTWEEIDAEIGGQLNTNTAIRIVTPTILSPTTKRAIEDFKVKYPNTEIVTYDAISSSAILEANEQTFGQQAIPDYHFDKAQVVVSFGADFLGTWISPVEYAADYAKNRKIEDPHDAKMSRLIQVESFMSLTGSNADNRILIKPSEQGAAIATLYNEVAALTGGTRINVPQLNEKAATALRKVAATLNENQGESLIISNSNNVGEQILVNAINNMLGNYGETLDFTHASMQRQGLDNNIRRLIQEMGTGKVGAVFVMNGANPAWDNPSFTAFQEAFASVPLKVSFSGMIDETTSLCDYVVPNHHLLESWGDAEPKRGQYSVIQPTINPIFNTRQQEETLLRWAESPNLNTEEDQPYFDYIKAHWEETVFPQQSKYATFQVFWDSTLHDGVAVVDVPAMELTFNGNVSEAASKINQPENTELEIAFFEDVKTGAGQYLSNPWLQELPDPVTRCTWGNYLQIPVSWEGGNEFTSFKNLNNSEIYGEADKVNVIVNGVEQTCTAIRQFGQKDNVVSMAMGYGRSVIGKTGREVGINTWPWMSTDENGNFRYYATEVQVSDKVSTEKRLACVQYHHTMGVEGTDPDSGETINVDEKTLVSLGEGFQSSLVKRSVIRRTNLNELESFIYGAHHEGDHGEEGDHSEGGEAKSFDELYQKSVPGSSSYEGLVHEREHHQQLNSYTLYPGYEELYNQGHHWGMHIDLNACTGCSACAVACMAENNVPVVGKTEVARHHEMAWLRIDRYYYGDYENPNVVYQPMMCQHCDNAPCENVCPVAATPHNEEGLNQMAYNRCIGTRYCANNCPYKVRRFNWLDYSTADIFPANEPTLNEEEIPFGADNLTRMVLNPDVTVRSRGVMEKCSFCVQRIQEGKLTAKREKRQLRDADVRTACQTACPTGAITFGDMNNKEGQLAQLLESDMNYQVLEEVNTRPAVTYSVRVTNKDEELMS